MANEVADKRQAVILKLDRKLSEVKNKQIKNIEMAHDNYITKLADIYASPNPDQVDIESGWEQ